MGLQGCPVCLKWLVLVFNLIFWLAGMGILALSIYLRVGYAQFVHANPHLENYYTGVYILMTAGGVMTLIGFFGCCGAYKESPCMLGTFFTLLLVVFTAEVAAGVWAYLNKDDLENIIDQALHYTITNYGDDDVQNRAVDTIQREAKCCGINGPRDWSDTKYGKGNNYQGTVSVELGVASSKGVFKVPRSCCSIPEDSAACKAASETQMVVNLVGNDIYRNGCKKALTKHLNEFLDIVAGVGIGIAIIELLGMILSMVLCCAVRREETYKH